MCPHSSCWAIAAYDHPLSIREELEFTATSAEASYKHALEVVEELRDKMDRAQVVWGEYLDEHPYPSTYEPLSHAYPGGVYIAKEPEPSGTQPRYHRA